MMQKYNYKYYEPLEQMIAVRHQYMSKIIKKITHSNIYDYLKNKKILDIGCGTCLLYTSPSPRDVEESRMPSSA